MPTTFTSNYGIRNIFRPLDSGYRYTADFKVTLTGLAYTPLIVTVLWNEKKTLIPGTLQTSTSITGASLSLFKEGTGWASLADIPGEEVWISYRSTVIRFRKCFTLEVPLGAGISFIPRINKVGEMMKELGVTKTTRVEVQGTFDIISYLGDFQSTVY